MYAVIYLPDVALQSLLRLDPDLGGKPLALLDTTVPKAVILQVTSAAHACGVTPGLTSTQAMARCREIMIRPRVLSQETATQDLLLQVAYAFSPAVESTAPGLCTLDLKGLSIPLLQVWAEHIVAQFQTLHLSARVGVAETPDLAWHAAHVAAPSVMVVEDSHEFVRRLPIESLNPSASLLAILHAWGVRTLGALVALGKERLAERLGPDSIEMFDRASAREIRPLNLASPVETFEESIEFEQEIETLEPLLFILRRFVEQLGRRLEMIYRVVGEFHLELQLTSGASIEKQFHIPAPTTVPDVLFRILHTHLENVKADAPVRALRLIAKPARAAKRQLGLFEAALRDPNQFYETIARLTALLGNDRVGTPVLEQSHRPDAFQLAVPAFEEDLAVEKTLPPPEGLPLRRFRPPLRAEVEAIGGRPVRLRSHGFTGAVKQARGPYRSSGHWWDTQRWAREDWEVTAANGSLLRLTFQHDHWLIDGEFD